MRDGDPRRHPVSENRAGAPETWITFLVSLFVRRFPPLSLPRSLPFPALLIKSGQATDFDRSTCLCIAQSALWRSVCRRAKVPSLLLDPFSVGEDYFCSFQGVHTTSGCLMFRKVNISNHRPAKSISPSISSCASALFCEHSPTRASFCAQDISSSHRPLLSAHRHPAAPATQKPAIVFDIFLNTTLSTTANAPHSAALNRFRHRRRALLRVRRGPYCRRWRDCVTCYRS